MGMFNYVDYEMICPVCYNKISEFQTKDGELELKTVKPHEVTNFYTTCPVCGCWIEFTAKGPATFVMVVTGKKKDKPKELLRKEVTL